MDIFIVSNYFIHLLYIINLIGIQFLELILNKHIMTFLLQHQLINLTKTKNQNLIVKSVTFTL